MFARLAANGRLDIARLYMYDETQGCKAYDAVRQDSFQDEIEEIEIIEEDEE